MEETRQMQSAEVRVASWGPEQGGKWIKGREQPTLGPFLGDGGGVGDASEPPDRGYRMALPSPTSLPLQNSEDLDKISFLLAI